MNDEGMAIVQLKDEKFFGNAVSTLAGRLGPIFSVSLERSGRMLSLILIVFFLYYFGIYPHYRPYDIDNPWFLSFSYDTCNQRIYTDQFMDTRFPAGMDGTQFFGKLAAYTQCSVLTHVGWQQRPSVFLSSLLVVFALGLWLLLLFKLKYSRRFVVCFLIVTGSSEPFLSMAEKARYEFLSFALVSLGLLLVAFGKPLIGAFIAGLAIEVEPMAIAGLIPIGVLAYQNGKSKFNIATRLFGGLVLAGGVYFALHPNILSAGLYLAQARKSSSQHDGGFVVAYFWHRWRHLPELVFFLAGSGLYWYRRRTLTSHYAALTSLIIVAFSLIMPHGNPAYVVFAYPFLVIVALSALRADRHAGLIVCCALLVALPQQIYLIYLTRNLGFASADLELVSQAVSGVSHGLHLDDKSLRIYGDYRLWFAHPHLYRAAAQSTLPEVENADIYLCFDHPPQPESLEPALMLYCGDLTRIVPLRLMDVVFIRKSQLYIYVKEQSLSP